MATITYTLEASRTLPELSRVLLLLNTTFIIRKRTVFSSPRFIISAQSINLQRIYLVQNFVVFFYLPCKTCSHIKHIAKFVSFVLRT